MEDSIIYLDLATLIESVGSQSATLRAILPKGRVVSLSEPAVATLRIEQGAIMNCMIETRGGKHIEGQKALDLLGTWEEWSISIDVPTLSSSSQPLPAQEVYLKTETRYEQRVPRQRRVNNLNAISQLPAKQRVLLRNVLMMVNGERTIAGIKSSLQLSPQTVDAMLDMLRQMQLIDY